MSTVLNKAPTLNTGDNDSDTGDWYTLTVDGGYKCECGDIHIYLTAGWDIIIFPEKDDPDMLYIATQMGKDPDVPKLPRVVAYESSMGSFVTWAQLNNEMHNRGI